MTGFGRAEALTDGFAVTVEARSVNHRHLDIALRLPRALAAFEMDARRLIAAAARARAHRRHRAGRCRRRANPRSRSSSTRRSPPSTSSRRGHLAATAGLAGTSRSRGCSSARVSCAPKSRETSASALPWPPVAEVLGRALDELVDRRADRRRALGPELSACTPRWAQVDTMAARAPAAVAPSRGAAARAHRRAARRRRGRRGAHPHRGGDLGREDGRPGRADAARARTSTAGGAPRPVAAPWAGRSTS